MSSVMTPPLATAEDDAPLVECAPKTDVSIPACSRFVLNHLAMVLVMSLAYMVVQMTGITSTLCHVVDLSCPNRYSGSLLDKGFEFSGNKGKKSSAIGFSCHDCLATVEGRRVIPMSPIFILFISNCAMSADLEGLVMTSRKTVFRVRYFRGSSLDCPRDSK